MATVVEPQNEPRFVLHGVSWQFYEHCLEEIGDRHIRLTYDRGSLEIMSPSPEHERYGRLIGRLILAFTEEMNVPIRSAGSTTWRREGLKRGLEPDDCYFIQHEALLRGRDEIDLSRDPPPDLAIEIEITQNGISKMPVYAALGIPEVWRFDGETLQVHCLTPRGEYVVQDRSPGLPLLPPTEVLRFLQRRNDTDETSWIRTFRQWVRENVI
jgi:Uma2 family endonuclease